MEERNKREATAAWERFNNSYIPMAEDSKQEQHRETKWLITTIAVVCMILLMPIIDSATEDNLGKNKEQSYTERMDGTSNLSMQESSEAQYKRLNEDEINLFREKYPMKANYRNPAADIFAISFQRAVEISEDWVWGKIKSEVIEKNGLRLYEIEVIDSVSGKFSAGEVLIIVVEQYMWDVLPVMDAGSEYIFGLYDYYLPGYKELYGIGLSEMFYVTDNQYILSVTGVEMDIKDRTMYSGYSVEEFMSVVTKIKNG